MNVASSIYAVHWRLGWIIGGSCRSEIIFIDGMDSGKQHKPVAPRLTFSRAYIGAVMTLAEEQQLICIALFVDRHSTPPQQVARLRPLLLSAVERHVGGPIEVRMALVD